MDASSCSMAQESIEVGGAAAGVAAANGLAAGSAAGNVAVGADEQRVIHVSHLHAIREIALNLVAVVDNMLHSHTAAQ